MNKYLFRSIFSLSLLLGLVYYVSAEEIPVLTATLDSQTPLAQTLAAGAQSVDVARVALSASVADLYINGIYLTTDASGGLSNFTNVYLYDVTTSTPVLKGTYPTQNENPNLIEFSNTILGNGGTPKTYLIRASLSPSASGNVRLGFSGFSFPTLSKPTLVNVPIYGNTLTLPGTVTTPTPIPTPSLSPTPIPSLTPTATATPTTRPTPISLGFTGLATLNLTEGDTISAVGSLDPDIYIANEHGYKRLFLNPIIFGFYGHLGGFGKVKSITPTTNSVLVTSGFFRNCETNLAGQADPKIYGVEVTGEDTGILHWVNTSGDQAVQDDPDFFKKVFCINTNEFNWYAKGSEYTSVNQVPTYSR